MHHEKHSRGLGGYIKDIVYGANDGIITTFAVVAGTIGASLDPKIILILGFSNLIADGFSMAASNFLGNRSEHALFQTEEKREYDEIEKMPDIERKEVYTIFLERGFTDTQSTQLTSLVSSNKHFWADFMMRYELGFAPENGTSELMSATMTFTAFVLAGSLPLFPFIFFNFGDQTFLFSIIFTGLALFSVGAARRIFTHKNFLISGLEMLVVGSIAAAVAYVIGYLVSQII